MQPQNGNWEENSSLVYATWKGSPTHNEATYGFYDRPNKFTFDLYLRKRHGWQVEVFSDILTLPINESTPIEEAKAAAIACVQEYLRNLLISIP